MTVHRVIEDWDPMVVIGDEGTVLVLVTPDVTLDFRTVAAFEEFTEQIDRGYIAARTSWSRRLYPQLFADRGIAERAS